MKNLNLLIILAIAGAIIGVAFVRMFLLNNFQIIGWNLFWKNLSHFNFDMFKLIFKSATFGKCFLGFLIGGGIGAGVGLFLNKK
ncbi:MAG TPA: hypothetical protein PK771_05340 [Spirochaetota bacterium]|nr:hypothetical protein [Spirochaetota bacterium]